MDKSGLVEIRRHLNGMASEMEDWAEDEFNEERARLQVRTWARRIRLEIESIKHEIDLPDALSVPEEVKARSSSARRLVASTATAIALVIPAVAATDEAWVDTRAAVEAAVDWGQSSEAEELAEGETLEEFWKNYPALIAGHEGVSGLDVDPSYEDGEIKAILVSFNYSGPLLGLRNQLREVEVEVSRDGDGLLLMPIDGLASNRRAPVDSAEAARLTFEMVPDMGYELPDEDLFRGDR